MKKLAIGCVGLLGVLTAGAVGASYLAYRKVSTAVAGFAELRTLPALDRSVRDRRPFAPPPSGELRESQLTRFLQVQQTVQSRLGRRAGEFERRYHALLEKDSAAVTDVPELVSAYRDLAAIYMDAKRAQVAALNESGFSLGEYRWVRAQAYGALGIPMIDFDVARIIDEVQSGRTPVQPAVSMPLGPTGSPATLKLVEPRRKILETNAPLAAFGL